MTDIDNIKEQIVNGLGNLPASTNSVQILIYGFELPVEEVEDNTDINFETEVKLDLSFETRLALLKGNIDKLLVKATNYETQLNVSPALSEEELELLTKEFKADINTIRFNLNGFADNLVFRETIKGFVNDIYTTLLQANAKKAWILIHNMFTVAKVKGNSLTSLKDLATEVQWDLNSTAATSVKVKGTLKQEATSKNKPKEEKEEEK